VSRIETCDKRDTGVNEKNRGLEGLGSWSKDTRLLAVERYLELDNGDCVPRLCRRGFRPRGNARLPANPEVME